MFAAVEHNFQEVVVIVYCRFFAKPKKKCFSPFSMTIYVGTCGKVSHQVAAR
jgi:hypothetical protein